MNKIMPKDNNRIIIGTNAVGHDSSIVYYDRASGEIFALDTERISRIKHDGTGIKDCCAELEKNLGRGLSAMNINEGYNNEDTFEMKNYLLRKQVSIELKRVFGIKYIDGLTRYWNLGKYRLLLETLKKLPRSWRIFYVLFINGVIRPYNHKSIDNLRRYITNNLRDLRLNSLSFNFYDHHLCHCIAAYYFSPFDKCLSISMDYSGDGSFSKIFLCEDGELRLAADSPFRPLNGNIENSQFSIGKIYSLVTHYLGFVPNSDEGKVEALAAYGNADNELYHELKKNMFIDKDYGIGLHKEAMDCVSCAYLDEMSRKYGHEGIAAGVQKFLEDFMVDYLKMIMDKYRVYDVCFSGGTFANVKLNMAIYERTPIQNQYIFPAMNDSGVAVGALIMRLKESGAIDFRVFKDGRYKMPYWGPDYSLDDIKKAVSKYRGKIKVEYLGEGWPEKVAGLVCDGKIGGIFQGRSEYGPRALGNRSILSDSRSAGARDRLNKVIKGRPYFQPFCPSILEEDRDKLFERSYPNKHMTCAFRMKEEYARKFPSAVHIDGTGRPQFVEESDNPAFYRLLKKTKEIIGTGILINTSFNRHGRTMVLAPEHAIVDFIDSQMDFLCLEGYLIYRSQT